MDPVKPIPVTPLSFVIRGAEGSTNSSPRWDRINSGEVLLSARRIYLQYFQYSPGGADPLGIVLNRLTGQGRVVFEGPVLLPEEQFVPMELVRGRVQRLRSSRSNLRS